MAVGVMAGWKNLLDEMVARGIARARVVVTGHTVLDEHVSLKRLGDLHLDTFPYNGHTTALDALWAGGLVGWFWCLFVGFGNAELVFVYFCMDVTLGSLLRV